MEWVGAWGLGAFMARVGAWGLGAFMAWVGVYGLSGQPCLWPAWQPGRTWPVWPPTGIFSSGIFVSNACGGQMSAEVRALQINRKCL